MTEIIKDRGPIVASQNFLSVFLHFLLGAEGLSNREQSWHQQDQIEKRLGSVDFPVFNPIISIFLQSCRGNIIHLSKQGRK